MNKTLRPSVNAGLLEERDSVSRAPLKSANNDSSKHLPRGAMHAIYLVEPARKLHVSCAHIHPGLSRGPKKNDWKLHGNGVQLLLPKIGNAFKALIIVRYIGARAFSAIRECWNFHFYSMSVFPTGHLISSKSQINISSTRENSKTGASIEYSTNISTLTID